MKCKKWHRAIHRLLDGETTAEQEKEIHAHIDQCPECSAYYRDMNLICSSLHEKDQAPPSSFRSAWKKSLNTRRAVRRKTRSGALIPAAACIAAAVFVVSTAVVNPQVFGLGGAQVRSEQGELSPSPDAVGVSDDQTGSGGIVFGDTVGGTPKVAKSAPQAVTAVFSETTGITADDGGDGIVAQGDLGESAAPVPAETSEDAPEEAAPERAAVSPFELDLHEEAAAMEVHRAAQRSGKIDIRDGSGCFLMEGNEADLRAALGAHGSDLPADTKSVLVSWDVEPTTEAPDTASATPAA